MMLVAGPPSVAPAVAAGPCEVVCSDVSLDEPGACGFENDGGCSFFPAQVVPADPGDVFCGRAWADGGFRDTDWYLLCVEDPDGDGVAQVCGTLISEFPGVCFILDGVGTSECSSWECDPVVVGQIGCGADCRNLAVASACVPAPGDYVVFVAPGHCDGSGIFDDYPCDTSNDYQLCITVTNACDEPCGDCPTGAACPADLDGDGSVGIVDFLWLLAQWGTDPGGPPDFDGDGTVGVSDFLVLLASWGPCP
ncbi:MAG: EF-hand domain-containing protein [Planctomycetota bacterium]